VPRFGQHGPWTSPEGYGIWSADRGVPPPGPQGGRGTRTTAPVTEPVIVAADILSDVHEKPDASVLWRRAREKEPARGADGLLRRDLRTAVRGGQPARLALDPDPGVPPYHRAEGWRGMGDRFLWALVANNALVEGVGYALACPSKSGHSAAGHFRMRDEVWLRNRGQLGFAYGARRVPHAEGRARSASLEARDSGHPGENSPARSVA
jgi:hypothetical protein